MSLVLVIFIITQIIVDDATSDADVENRMWANKYSSSFRCIRKILDLKSDVNSQMLLIVSCVKSIT
jgi:hypothetical protein